MDQVEILPDPDLHWGDELEELLVRTQKSMTVLLPVGQNDDGVCPMTRNLGMTGVQKDPLHLERES